jgi:hypothetical protein
VGRCGELSDWGVGVEHGFAVVGRGLIKSYDQAGERLRVGTSRDFSLTFESGRWFTVLS